MKSFFPKTCPACSQPLVVEVGDKSETLKLMCKNDLCAGSLLKRLQKGIIALEIRGLGPKVIENLMNAGITSSLDLFDPEIFNEENLIASGYFKKGRSLEKIMTSVKSTKSIPIQKAILSLQIDDVGKTFSLKIGQKFSGLDVDFTGLQYNIREQLDIEDSELNKQLKSALDKFEKFGIEVIKYEKPKQVVATKKVLKKVAVEGTYNTDDYEYGLETDDEILKVVKKLNWGIVSVDDSDCKMLIVTDKNDDTPDINKAKELGVKIMTLKQIKLLFL